MDSFKTLQDSLSAALVSTTRSATQLSGADIPFQRSFNPALGRALDAQNARLLQIAQRLLENAAASSDAVGPKLPDVEAVDGNWRDVVDVVDSLLEKADTSLDEYTGVVKRLSPTGDQAVATTPKARFHSAPKNFQKPQLLFDHVPKNNETGGFRPLMTSKPHAKVPLEKCLQTFKDSQGLEQYLHPYQTEIESYEYPQSMYQVSEPQPYTPFETTTATFVDTPEALASMLAELKTAKEIAVDLEHHDNRSYVGLVSLMQISTRNKDWIVDTLKPWRRDLECLNEVFADPNIIKVFHGSFMDIIWLQRDLGLYVVGLFDTYHAARALGYPGGSLAFLLEKFVNFKAQKQYQMADWRIRPLSDELFTYARADTHFLLYIFDNMKNELVENSNFADPEKNKVLDVLTKSRETALKRYEHHIYDTENGLGSMGWFRQITRTPAQFTSQQFAVFKAVHRWRDAVARMEDDNPTFIMPNHAIFSIARSLPEDRAALFSVTQHVSPALRTRADELIAAVAKAKNVGPDAPELNETIKRISDLKYAARDGGIEAPKVTKSSVQVAQPAPVRQAAPLPASQDLPPLRAASSKFWGSLWSGLGAEQRRPASTLSINLALPLPPLTAEIFADTTGLATEESIPKVEKPVFVAKEDRPAQDERTDIFVVKQLGGKRKRNMEEPAPAVTHAKDEFAAGEAEEIMLEETERDRRKREKAAHKEAKAKKKALKQQEAEQLDYADEEAFDYAAAPSVLRAREAEQQRAGGKKKREKKKDARFDPYKGMGDAPKGLPRTMKEKAGRSKTFTS